MVQVGGLLRNSAGVLTRWSCCSWLEVCAASGPIISPFWSKSYRPGSIWSNKDVENRKISKNPCSMPRAARLFKACLQVAQVKFFHFILKLIDDTWLFVFLLQEKIWSCNQYNIIAKLPNKILRWALKSAMCLHFACVMICMLRLYFFVSSSLG
jgi:hypothetical protein